MANRILNEKICTSRSMNKLSYFEENLFIRLLTKVDDYGVFYSEPRVLASYVYPFKDIDEDTIKNALDSLIREEMIEIVDYEGEGFLIIKNWLKYQCVKNKKSKYLPFDIIAEKTKNVTYYKKILFGKKEEKKEKIEKSEVDKTTQCEGLSNLQEGLEKKISNPDPNPDPDPNPNPNPNPDPNPNPYPNPNPDSNPDVCIWEHGDLSGPLSRTKLAFGTYKNIYLTENQFNRIKTFFPEDYEMRIDDMSEYLASTGKTYANYEAALIRYDPNRYGEKPGTSEKTAEDKSTSGKKGKKGKDKSPKKEDKRDFYDEFAKAAIERARKKFEEE